MKSVKKFLKRSEISFVTKGQLKDDGVKITRPVRACQPCAGDSSRNRSCQRQGGRSGICMPEIRECRAQHALLGTDGLALCTCYRSQKSKVPIPNRRLVPSSREKRGKTGKNGGKQRKDGGKWGKTGGKRGKTGEILGGYFGQDPPTRILPPPRLSFCGEHFLPTKLKPRRSAGLGIPTPKGDAHSKEKIINMHVTH